VAVKPSSPVVQLKPGAASRPTNMLWCGSWTDVGHVVLPN
jgi:hypothetical protein